MCLICIMLLSILENRFSVTGTSLEWFRSYLTDRTQIFTAGLTSASPIPLVFGVPQGSGLSPVELIAIHWNHYRHFLQSPYSVPPICWWHTRLRPLLRHWCPSAFIPPVGLCQRLDNYSSLCLQLNPAKTEFIWFGSRSNLAKISSEYRGPYCNIFTNPLCPYCAHSWCDVWFRIIHEVTHQQNCKCVFFPPQKAATTARCSDR